MNRYYVKHQSPIFKILQVILPKVRRTSGQIRQYYIIAHFRDICVEFRLFCFPQTHKIRTFYPRNLLLSGEKPVNYFLGKLITIDRMI